MIASAEELLAAAQTGGYAVGAFNVYNLEGVCAVVRAAESERSPVMLQIHPSAMRVGGSLLLSLCLEAARRARVPVGVHLDHSAFLADIREALELGFPSVMADGAHLSYSDNIAFCSEAMALARAHGATVEVELGRLTGTEQDWTASERNARLTDPAQAAEFMERTGASFLAVCIGNVHGRHRGEPALDFERLQEIRRLTHAPLVLHGVSGMSPESVRRAIDLGVCKFNVNTEVRDAYMAALTKVIQSRKEAPHKKPGLLTLMNAAIGSMERVVRSKLRDFGSSAAAS